MLTGACVENESSHCSYDWKVAFLQWPNALFSETPLNILIKYMKFSKVSACENNVHFQTISTCFDVMQYKLQIWSFENECSSHTTIKKICFQKLQSVHISEGLSFGVSRRITLVSPEIHIKNILYVRVNVLSIFFLYYWSELNEYLLINVKSKCNFENQSCTFSRFLHRKRVVHRNRYAGERFHLQRWYSYQLKWKRLHYESMESFLVFKFSFRVFTCLKNIFFIESSSSGKCNFFDKSEDEKTLYTSVLHFIPFVFRPVWGF